MSLNEFVKNMEGRLYHYRGEDHRVQKAYLSSEGVAIITTDRDLIKVDDATIENLEIQFIPLVNNNGIVQKREFTSIIKAETPTIVEALIDDIKKLKHDKGYVQQAQARRNSIESLIKLARLEVDIYRAIERPGK